MPPRAFFLLMCVVCKYKAGEREVFLLVLDFFTSSQMFTHRGIWRVDWRCGQRESTTSGLR